MWTCPKCHAKVDATFEVCWQCGTTADGVEDPFFVVADDAEPIVDPPVTEEGIGTVGFDPSDLSTSPFGPDADVVECYTAEDRMQAHFLADELTKIGVPAYADTHEPNESFGGMASLPKVWVRSEDFPRARVWLDGYELIHREQHPAAGD